MERIKFFTIVILLYTIFMGVPQSLAAQEKTTIRVGLSNSSFSTYEFLEATIVTTAQTTVTDMSSGKQQAEIPMGSEITAKMQNGQFYIYIDGEEVLKGLDGPIVAVSSGKLGIKGLNRKGNPAFYKGMIEFKKAYPETRGKFNIVNVLDLQTYLKGVVPNEMPVSFGLNALKAQAVAARNYANRPQNTYKNYDICDSTACQVYYGANSQTALSDRAVDETLGIYALYNKEPILALYSSTGGGITEDYDKVYGNGINVTKPYLKAKKDNNSVEFPKNEDEIREFYSKNVPSFDMKSPKHRWRVEFDRFELEDVLNKTLKEQSMKGLVYPAFDENSNVYGIEDIRVTKRGTSGKALEVEIRSMGGTWRVKKELGIRRVFKKGKSILWSGNFFVEKKNTGKYKNLEENVEKKEKKPESGEDEAEGGIIETLLQVSKPENRDGVIKNAENKEDIKKKRVYKNHLKIALPDTFTFIGGGFGHGVGMSQYGAGFLSANGVGFDAILKHYYSGIKLGTTVSDVCYNNYNQNYTLNVFTDGLNRGTAGNLPPSISQNPMRSEVLSLYNYSKRPAKYILNIDYSKRPQSIEFNVNQYHFKPDTASFKGKLLKMDITKYLKNGKNTITFMPLKLADKDKQSAFWVEIEK